MHPAPNRFQQYTHASNATGTPMRFTVFLPPQAEKGPVPVRRIRQPLPIATVLIV